MLDKLALRNAKRSLKDYGIYIISITIIFSLLYAFNMIVYSEDIIKLCSTMEVMPYVVTVVSALIVLVSIWLVHYMNDFMLQRRSKEFGIYMSLGIHNSTIAQLFFRENVIIGFLSFLISLASGSFLYQILVTIVMHIFEMPYQLKVVFSFKALLQTFLYVFLIFAFSLIRSQHKLRKVTIYNLLYAEKKNETQMFSSIKGGWIIFIISLIAGAVGGVALWNNMNDGDNDLSLKLLGITFLCMIIFIYGFYISISTILVKIFTSNTKLKYKKGNILLVRSLSAKINTMRITLGTLSLLIVLTLTSFSIGIMLKDFFESQVNSISPFDVAISSENTGMDLENYTNYIHKNLYVDGEFTYFIYESGSTAIYNMLLNTPIGGSRIMDDTVMKYSDYQKLRELLGYSKVDLKDDCFLVQCVQGVKTELEKTNVFTLKLADRTLKYQGCYLEDFALQGINGVGYLVVVPDEIVKTMKARQIIYATNTKEETTVDDYNNLCDFNTMLKKVTQNGITHTVPQDDIKVKGELLAKSRSIFTILAFSLFYLGLVFICIAATILAVHHISDSVRYKFRYKILSNLGMECRKINDYILKQCLFYFGFPIILPIPISIYIAYCFNPLLKAFSSKDFFFTSMMSSVGLFLFVYFLYFIATFISYKKNVSE